MWDAPLFALVAENPHAGGEGRLDSAPRQKVLPSPAAALMSGRWGRVGVLETHRGRAKVRVVEALRGFLFPPGASDGSGAAFIFHPPVLPRLSPASRWAASSGVAGGVLAFLWWVAVVVSFAGGFPRGQGAAHLL